MEMEINTKGREEILSLLEPYLLPEDLEQVEAAYIFAKYGHRNQLRDSGVRYFEHPKSVALIAIEELKLHTDWKLIVMNLLHDIGEDSFVLSWNRIRVNFGREVAFGVKLVTKIKGEAHEEYVGRILKYGSKRVCMVKLCDRLHNMRTLLSCREEKITREKLRKRKSCIFHLQSILLACCQRKKKQLVSIYIIKYFLFTKYIKIDNKIFKKP